MLRAIVRIFSGVATIVVIATVFFHYVEGWGWVDSYFFSIVTLSTVGYGDIVPTTDLGKIATTVLIVVGLGIFAIAIQQFGELQYQRREEKARLRREHELEREEERQNG